MDRWKSGHPWSGTIQQFFDLIADRYGLGLHRMTVTDPYGGPAVIYYLQIRDSSTTVQLPGLDLDDPLNEVVLGSLCRRLGIPPEDFGLRPEEPMDESEVFELN